MTYRRPARRTLWLLVAGLVAVAAVIAVVRVYQSPSSSAATASRVAVPRSGQPVAPTRNASAPADPPLHSTAPSTESSTVLSPVRSPVWPALGQAAYVQAGRSQVQVGPDQHPAPIASIAKVMTAYLVLRDHPLSAGQDGPTITLTSADVADTARRRRHQESIVSVVAGERLSERQAVEALLLPSANNIAAVLARWDAGSADRFVARMNATARSLGMTHTRYTDPSGYDNATVSTAADQVDLVERAMRLSTFARIVATSTATLPVAGVVHNTDTLLGRHGFVGIKTGSDSAAGGCFAFRAIRVIDGRRTTITGVVLGQPGPDLIAAGLAAAEAIVDRIATTSTPRETS